MTEYINTVLNYAVAPIKIICDRTMAYLYPQENKNEIRNEPEVIDKNEKGEVQTRLYEENKLNNILTFFKQPTHIIDNIYIGSAFNAATYYSLKNLNIKVIINVTSELNNYYPAEFIYVKVPIMDDNKQSIEDYLDNVYQIIKTHQGALTKGNILIHCFMGASRSASIVTDYLMRTMKHPDGTSITFDEALNFLKQKRPIVNPTFRLAQDVIKKSKKNKPIPDL